MIFIWFSLNSFDVTISSRSIIYNDRIIQGEGKTERHAMNTYREVEL